MSTIPHTPSPAPSQVSEDLRRLRFKFFSLRFADIDVGTLNCGKRDWRWFNFLRVCTGCCRFLF